MIIRAIKNELKKEDKYGFVVILLLVFAYICGNNISIAKLTGMSAGEFILFSVSNHYYFIYGFFFFFLYWTAKSFRNVRNIEIIRFGSFKKYYIVQCLTVIIKVGIVIAAHFLIAFALGVICFGFTNNFSNLNLENYYSNTVGFVLEFSKFFDNPIQAACSVLLFLLLGCSFIYNILFFIRQLFSPKGLVIAIVCIVLNVMIGFKSVIDESIIECFFLNNYFILHHSLFTVGKFAVILNVIIMITAPIVLCHISLIKMHPRAKYGNMYLRSMIQGDMRITILIITFLLLLNLILVYKADGNSFDYIYYNIRGFSIENFNFMEFLSFIAYFIYPIFVINVFWENEKKDRNIIAKFRFGSRKKWDQELFGISITFLLKYYLIYEAGMLVFALLLHSVLPENNSYYLNEIATYYNISKPYIIIAIVISNIMRIFELLLLYELSSLVFNITNNTVLSFMCSFLVYFIEFPLKKIGQWYPFGASSLYRILETYKLLNLNEQYKYYLYSGLSLIIIILLNRIIRRIKQWQRL